MSLVKKFELDDNNFGYSKKTIPFCLIGVGVLLLTQVWVAHITTTSGEKLKEIEKLKKIISLDNKRLENEIAYFLSLSHIATEAASLGLKSPKSIQYIR